MDNGQRPTNRISAEISRAVGMRLKAIRLSKGWTQEHLARRSDIALSTLKLLESTGKGSFQRLIRVAICLGVDHEIERLFASSHIGWSRESQKLSNRQRAPRRSKN